MARGSFHEDWNDLLTRFAHRREHERYRAEQLERAQKEAGRGDRCRNYRLNQALFERASGAPGNVREAARQDER